MARSDHRPHRYRAPIALPLTLVVLYAGSTRDAPAEQATANIAKSGYVLNAGNCGEAPLRFPKLPIGMRAGYCAGLVASRADGLAFPRSIVQIPGSHQFIIADLAGWGVPPGQGRLLLLDPEAPEGKRIRTLISGLDLPHGLAVGIDQRIYASTVDKIFRFDPLAQNPESTIQIVVQRLPGRRPLLPDGTQPTNAHPLKHFIFDKNGRIYVNIGAPSDNCAGNGPQPVACAAGEGDMPLASVWAFTPPPGGIFPTLSADDENPAVEVYAHGLRNSMALAAHARFPEPGFAFLQGENSRDLPESNRPNDELNALEKGRHYGWPYCYDISTESPEYAAYLQVATKHRKFCTDAAAYRRPHSLLPPHSSPLAMLYYQGTRFPELTGKLVVGLHGFRQPTGSRLIYYDVDEKGFPIISPAPVRYNVSCANPPTAVFHTEREGQVPAAAFRELIAHWYKVEGVRPQGTPVGVTVASDGAIWLVEDHNQTIIRIDREPTAPTGGPQPCNAGPEAQTPALRD